MRVKRWASELLTKACDWWNATDLSTKLCVFVLAPDAGWAEP